MLKTSVWWVGVCVCLQDSSRVCGVLPLQRQHESAGCFQVFVWVPSFWARSVQPGAQCPHSVADHRPGPSASPHGKSASHSSETWDVTETFSSVPLTSVSVCGFQLVLLCLILYFLVRGILGLLREGYMYLLSSWRVLGIFKLCLAASVCGLHLSRSVMARQQWTLFLKRRQDAFTDFQPLARQSQLYAVMSAMLLFILVLKVTQKKIKYGTLMMLGYFKGSVIVWNAEMQRRKNNIQLQNNLGWKSNKKRYL